MLNELRLFNSQNVLILRKNKKLSINDELIEIILNFIGSIIRFDPSESLNVIRGRAIFFFSFFFLTLFLLLTLKQSHKDFYWELNN